MTRVEYDRAALSLSMEGHAGAGEPGYDLVCAALSTLMMTLERRVQENVHFPHITAPEKFHARIWGNCTTTCSDTGEMGGKPRAAHAEKRTFPQHRCTKFPRCKDMGEMYGKGLDQPPDKTGMFAVAILSIPSIHRLKLVV